MKFKEPKLIAELERCSRVLLEILEDFEEISHALYGIEPMVTRVIDPINGESGVHLDRRAVDLRDQHDGVFLYTPEQSKSLVEAINSKWKRNDGKVTCIHHSFNSGPFHFHLQIPVSTKAYEQ